MGKKLVKLLNVDTGEKKYSFELLINRMTALKIAGKDNELNDYLFGSFKNIDQKTLKEIEGKTEDELTEEQKELLLKNVSKNNFSHGIYLTMKIAPIAFKEMVYASGKKHSEEELNEFIAFMEESEAYESFCSLVFNHFMEGFTQDNVSQDKPKVKITLS